MLINPIVRPPGPGVQVQELAGAGTRPEDGTGSASLFAAIFALMMGQQAAVPVPAADAPQAAGGEAAAAGTPGALAAPGAPALAAAALGWGRAPSAFGAPATGQVPVPVPVPIPIPVPGDPPPSMPLVLNPAAAPLHARLALQLQAQMQAQAQVVVQAQAPAQVEAVSQPQVALAGDMVLPAEASSSLPPTAQVAPGTAPQMPVLTDPVLSAPPIAPAAWRPVAPQPVIAQMQAGTETPEVSPAKRTADEREPSTLDDALMSLGLDLLRRDAFPIAPKTTSAAPVAADAATTYSPDQLMEQVAGTARESQDGSYTLTLRLHPEHLGEVRLQLRLSGREVQTVFQVASPEARQALESRFDQLRQNLTQSGLQLSGFDVQTGGGDRRHWEQERAEQFAQVRRQEEQPAAAKPADLLRIRRFTTVRGAGGLDTIA